MADDISKLCSDFLRVTYSGLKASHARELVAAFFGYNSHAALLCESRYSLDKLDEAAILIPDVLLIEKRRPHLNGLPEGLVESKELAEELADYLQENNLFSGEVWIFDDGLLMYMLEDYLPNNVDSDLDNYLSDAIAGTNAYFDEPYYDSGTVENGRDFVKITVPGTYNGQHDIESDSSFMGDTIDMEIVVQLERIAGRTAFAEPEVDVTGGVNDDWRDIDHDIEDDEPAA